MNEQNDIESISLLKSFTYCKYQCVTNKRKRIGKKHFDDPNKFVEYLNIQITSMH